MAFYQKVQNQIKKPKQTKFYRYLKFFYMSSPNKTEIKAKKNKCADLINNCTQYVTNCNARSSLKSTPNGGAIIEQNYNGTE